MNKQNIVYITAAKRTAIGSFMKSLSGVDAAILGSKVILDLLKCSSIASEAVSEIIMGQVLAAGQGQNPARQAAMHASIPHIVPSYNVAQVCGSGLKAVELGAQSIMCNNADIVICGGQENMSRSMHASYLRLGNKFGDMKMLDTMMKDGLSDAFSGKAMGVTAENIAEKYNISRQAQDDYAYQSQQKAALAQREGWFEKEITPVEIKIKRELQSFAKDEFIRSSSTIEDLAKLSPVFKEGGSVTAANSSGINDGAAAVMLASTKAVAQHNLTPIAKVIDSVTCGVDPAFMGTGPIPAINALLKRNSLGVADIDLFEVNEAFAAQSICVLEELQIPFEKANIAGGAIALGHPIGASGARVLVTLLHNLQRVGGRYGIASLCIGGGMGIAMLIEIEQ